MLWLSVLREDNKERSGPFLVFPLWYEPSVGPLVWPNVTASSQTSELVASFPEQIQHQGGHEAKKDLRRGKQGNLSILAHAETRCGGGDADSTGGHAHTRLTTSTGSLGVHGGQEGLAGVWGHLWLCLCKK